MIPNGIKDHSPRNIIELAEHVWSNRNDFIRWPKESILFMPDVIRTKYHQYTYEQKQRLKTAGITPDSRSNGPAIMSYKLAGGERPRRVSPGREWSIHHIYDGKFPFTNSSKSIHAVNDGRYFTESAGLVAVHPVADEVPYFAWLLRQEAYVLFEFDPDHVFKPIG